jgi:hypothetical protein
MEQTEEQGDIRERDEYEEDSTGTTMVKIFWVEREKCAIGS